MLSTGVWAGAPEQAWSRGVRSGHTGYHLRHRSPELVPVARGAGAVLRTRFTVELASLAPQGSVKERQNSERGTWRLAHGPVSPWRLRMTSGFSCSGFRSLMGLTQRTESAESRFQHAHRHQRVSMRTRLSYRSRSR